MRVALRINGLNFPSIEDQLVTSNGLLREIIDGRILNYFMQLFCTHCHLMRLFIKPVSALTV